MQNSNTLFAYLKCRFDPLHLVSDARYLLKLLPCMQTNVQVFVQVVNMTLYVKGFKIDRRKIANLLEVTSETDPLVEAGISVVVERLNRDAYLKMVTGYEGRDPDGNRNVELIIALEFDKDEERLKEKGAGDY